MIRMMVLQLGGTSDEAKDIFQEGLLIILEKIDTYEFNLSSKFKTFLYCICENLWKSVLDRRTAEMNYLYRVPVENLQEDFSEESDYNMRQEIFREAYESLDSLGKTILKLSWEEISPREIAKMTGLSYGYVRKKKCKIKAELIGKIKSHPDYSYMVEPGIMAVDADETF